MLSGLSFYLVPKLLASDLILTVDAAAGKAGIWPGGSLQNSEFISGDTFLLPTCLRGRDKRAPCLCLSASRFIYTTDTAPSRTNTYPRRRPGYSGRSLAKGARPRVQSPDIARVCAFRLSQAQWGPGEVLILFCWRPVLGLLLWPNQSTAAVAVAFPHAFSAKSCRVPHPPALPVTPRAFGP